MNCIECGSENTFRHECSGELECLDCGRMWYEGSKEHQWYQLKTILLGALEAHKVSGNDDRKSEIEWVLSQIKLIEESR